MARRLPAWCGAPTRAEAAQGLGSSLARPHESTAPCPALTKPRREVLGQRTALESRGRRHGTAHAARLPRPANRPNHATIVHLATGCAEHHGPPLVPQQTSGMLEHVGPPERRAAAWT